MRISQLAEALSAINTILLKRTLLAAVLWNGFSALEARTLQGVADNAATLQLEHRLTNQAANASNLFLDDEAIDLQFNFTFGADRVGKTAKLFAVADYGGVWFQRAAAGDWLPWDGNPDSLQAIEEKTLSAQESLALLQRQSLPAGEFLLYVGYQAAGEQTLFYNQTPLAFAVFNQQQAALHRVQNQALLTQVFATGSYQQNTLQRYGEVWSGGAVATTADSVSDNVKVSQTNLQEAGVDEGDRIKVQGRQLFALETCSDDKSQACVAAYQLQADPAQNTRLGQLALNTADNNGQLYLTAAAPATLVHLASSQTYPVARIWDMPYYWLNQSTTVQTIDPSRPEAMSVSHTIKIDGSLVASRMLNGVLYLLTRKNAYFDTPIDIIYFNMPSDIVMPVTTQTAAANSAIDINSLLPTISIDGGPATMLAAAGDCYLPRQSSEQIVANNLVTLVAIPVAAPENYYSTCIAGNIDTYYMSTQALYLASSRYPYQIQGNGIVYSAGQEIQTDIHKFALADGRLQYRGSGSVPGHLGWEVDKQPFRMGEHNGILKVATSLGETWSANSTTRVGVLQEADNQLSEVAYLDNLGKPGERLYAARFIGDRGYLVTFRVTDPLYVLDFSQPAQPQVLGELTIAGYSDYLHPIGENFLLGVGKDAVADSVGDGRGAWYQGVKLSLFDVSQPQQLREVDSVVIGKRGTDSALLADHHAMAWLQNSADSGYFSLPIELHESPFPAGYGYGQDYYQRVNAYYDWTHTGLYTFTIDTGSAPGIRLLKQVISEENNGSQTNVGTYNDRAVLLDNSVHYVHDNRVISSSLAP